MSTPDFKHHPGRRAAAVLANAAALALPLALLAPAAHALEITLPNETAQYRESDLPGYQLAQRNCLICHSAQYVMTQPPGSQRSYWDATVKKMRHPFGAPLPEDEVAPIVDYLVKTYGVERPQAVGKGAPMPTAPTATAGSLNLGNGDNNADNDDSRTGNGKR